MNIRVNDQFVLKSRPNGLPTPENFEIRRVPIDSIPDGTFLVQNEMLGLAPASRMKMSENRSYTDPTPIGGVIYGQSVGKIVRSSHADFSVGERVVLTNGGWQTHSISDGTLAMKIDESIAPASMWLSVLGVSGMTAYAGLFDVGHLKPSDIVVVSAASGAVGSLAGQMAQAKGCRVIGVAGGFDKCNYVTRDLNFTACLDYRAPTFLDDLAEVSEKEIDLFFDNVGGRVRAAALNNMADFGRVVVCGMIAEYNSPGSIESPSWLPILAKRLTVRGFLLRDHFHIRDNFLKEVSHWLKDGKIRIREDVTIGFENTAEAFTRMLVGEKIGKSLVKI